MQGPATTPNLEHQLERIADSYVRSTAIRHPWRTFLDTLQPLSITAAVIAVILTLPQVSLVLRERTPNDDLLSLGRSFYLSATASSYVDPDPTSPTDLSFSPSNVLDDNPATAWQECAGTDRTQTRKATERTSSDCPPNSSPTAEGSGEWLELNLVEPIDLQGIRVRNGYDRTYDLYRQNPRVNRIRIETFGLEPDERWSREYPLEDDFTAGYQYLPFRSGGVRGVVTVRLTIVSAFPPREIVGQKSYEDNGLSDLQLVPRTLKGTDDASSTR